MVVASPIVVKVANVNKEFVIVQMKMVRQVAGLSSVESLNKTRLAHGVRWHHQAMFAAVVITCGGSGDGNAEPDIYNMCNHGTLYQKYCIHQHRA